MKSRIIVLASLVPMGMLLTTHAQAPGPLYLREMPSEERILRDIHGSDAIDTAARQFGAFEQLQQIIRDLALAAHRDDRQWTADEKRLVALYQNASARAWQPVQKAFAQNRPRLFELSGYSTNPDFTAELLNQFFSPAFRALYAKANETFARRHAEFEKQQQQEMAQARARPDASANGTSDPGTLAMRRCVTAGRDPLQCFGEVFQSSMQTMAGGQAGMGSNFGAYLPTGLRMTGRYGDGHFFLAFTEDTLWITCNQSSTQANYTVALDQSRVVVATTPGREGAKLGNKPFSLALTPEGNIVASGAVQITSMVPAPGSRPQTRETRRRYISEEEAKHAPYWENPQRDAGGNPYVDEPVASGGAMISKTSTCQLGTIRPLGSTGPTHATQTLNPLFGSMAQGAPWGQRSAKDKAWPGPGLRLHGEYAGQGGMSLEFHEDSVVVGCKQALLASPYSIRYSNNQSIVSIENGNNPVTLALGSDGNLSASGPVQVAGHAFVGDKNDGKGPMFAPSAATCMIGTLTAVR